MTKARKHSVCAAGAVLIAALLSGCIPDLTGTHQFTANIEDDGEGGYKGTVTFGDDAAAGPESETFDRPPGLGGPYISKDDVPSLLNHAISDADWATASDLLSSSRPYRYETLCSSPGLVVLCTAYLGSEVDGTRPVWFWNFAGSRRAYLTSVLEDSPELYGEKHGIHLIRTGGTRTILDEVPAAYLSYGGWLDRSAFRVEITQVQTDYVAGTSISGGAVLAHGDSLGRRSDGYPSLASSFLPILSATWRGLMVGAVRDEARRNFDPIQGEATLTYYPGENPYLATHHEHQTTLEHTMNAAFTDIYNLRTGDTLPDIRSLLQAEVDGTFASFPSVGPRRTVVRGRFYGPNHEEAGGVVTGEDLVGAFGARREVPATPGGGDASGPE